MNYLLYCIAWSIYTNCHMNDIAIVHMKTKALASQLSLHSVREIHIGTCSQPRNE
jgi:hypothetical protein